jgi:Arc/MetJ-type ribon-helix-helix transcriptional regulator
MISIPVALDEETIKKIDILVVQGFYKNRSEALRDQIVKGLAKIELVSMKTVNSERRDAIIKRLLSMEEPFNLLPTAKSVTDLVSEGRER